MMYAVCMCVCGGGMGMGWSDMCCVCVACVRACGPRCYSYAIRCPMCRHLCAMCVLCVVCDGG